MTQEYKAYDRSGIEIKVGDKVKMVAYKDEITDYDINGMGKGIKWECQWNICNEMNKLGETFTVSKIDYYGVELEGMYLFSFPSAAFENLSAADKMPIELKPFMRVKHVDGYEGTIVPCRYGELKLASTDGETYISLDKFDLKDGSYKIIEVYDLPENIVDIVKPSVKGKLLWKAKDEQAIKKAKEAVEKAQQQMKEAAKALEEAAKALEEARQQLSKVEE